MTMMGTIIKNSFLLLLLTFSSALCAQQEDFQTRLGVEVSGDLVGDFEWSAKVQQRWRYNSSVNDRTFLQGGLSYAPYSFVKIGLGYRGSFINEEEGTFVYKQRMHTEVVGDYSIDRVKLVYRSRLQYGFNDFQTLSFVDGDAITWRNRLGIKYNPFGSSFRPQASIEIFNKLNVSDERSLEGVRYIIGTEYLLSQQLSVSVDFILNKELNDSDPMTENILSASLSYSF